MNAMVFLICNGRTTNTVLHLIAIAHEAGVDFTMKDIDELSRNPKHMQSSSQFPLSCTGCQTVQAVSLQSWENWRRAGLINSSVRRVDLYQHFIKQSPMGYQGRKSHP